VQIASMIEKNENGFDNLKRIIKRLFSLKSRLIILPETCWKYVVKTIKDI
jgi:hypothetical protein